MPSAQFALDFDAPPQASPKPVGVASFMPIAAEIPTKEKPTTAYCVRRLHSDRPVECLSRRAAHEFLTWLRDAALNDLVIVRKEGLADVNELKALAFYQTQLTALAILEGSWRKLRAVGV